MARNVLWAGGRCRAGLGPRGLRAPPAPAAPRGPGPWPLQCPRPVTRGKRRARWPLAGPAPTRTGRGSAVGGHAGPPALRPTLCCGRCCCWCPGSCHVRRGHQETPVDVSWHSAHHWPARGRPSLCQGPQALPPSGCPTQDLGLWPGPTPQSCKAQRHRGTWLHQASLPSCLLLPQIRGRVPCCKLLTRTQGHRQPLSPPSPKHLPWAPSGPLTPHRPCQPWTPTSLDHEPRGLVGSGWQCGPPRPPDPRVPSVPAGQPPAPGLPHQLLHPAGAARHGPARGYCAVPDPDGDEQSGPQELPRAHLRRAGGRRADEGAAWFQQEEGSQERQDKAARL